MQVIGNNYWSAQIQKKEEGWQDNTVEMLSTNPQIQKKSTNPNEGRVAGLYSWNVEHKSKRNPQIQKKEGWQDYIVELEC